MAAKIAIAAGAVAGALAAPHHFTESFSEAEFVLTGPASPAETVTFTAALPWTNFDKLDAELAEISNPDSARYGEWMTAEQVNKLTAPLPEHRRAAKAFLAAKGAGCVDFPHSLKCTIKVADAEKLFKTKLSSFEQTTRGGKKVIRVHPNDAYAFPSELAGKVSFFSGLTHFPTVKARNGHIHATGAPAKATKNIRAGATDYFVLPETVAAFYKPGSTVGGAAAIQAPAEFQDDASFNGKDLEKFITEAGVPKWNVTKKVGPYSPASPDLEATLDEQYIGTTGTGNTNWYWTETEWMYEWTQNIAATPDSGVPQIFSVSWGWSEADQCTIDQAGPCSSGNDSGSAAYVTASNQGFAAAGARGISILVSSGDSGAHGRTDPTCSSPKTRPDWPTASPYILSVGATQIQNGAPISAPTSAVCKAPPAGLGKCAGSGTEIVCSPATGALIASGGGFSNVAASPSWQTTAVKTYLAGNPLLPPSTSDYNATGRAYPDVAALGHNVGIYAATQGGWLAVDGTSCSTPIFSGIVGMANAQRLAAGKKVLGFLPPSIYKIAASTPAAFTDVTVGNNKCTENGCAASCTGFGAAKGWDATTGWGTPNVPALVAALVAL